MDAPTVLTAASDHVVDNGIAKKWHSRSGITETIPLLVAALALTLPTGKALPSFSLALRPQFSDGVRAAFFRTLKVPVINLPSSFQFANNPFQTMCSALCVLREEKGSSGLQTRQTSLPMSTESEQPLYLRASCLQELEIASHLG